MTAKGISTATLAPGSPGSQPPGDAAVAQKAGRGGIAIAIAKVSFIVFGFAQQLVLTHLLGGDGYGEIRRVFAVVGIVNNVIVGTAIQGVSRAVSTAGDAHAASAFRKTLIVHTAIAAFASLALAIMAGPITSFMHAKHVLMPLRIVAAVVLLYGVYAPLVGALNGMRRFVDQAGLDIGYGVLRLATTAAGALLFMRAGGSGIVGAAAGFATAALLIVPAALSRSGVGARGPGGPSTRAHLTFVGPLVIGQIFLNLLIQTDLILLSRFAGQAAEALALGSKAADRLVGAYGAMQLFSLLPYQLLISISFVLFPMLARARAEADASAIAEYTRTGVRIAFIVAGAMCGTISALGPHVLRFAFPAEMAELAGEALRVHSLGMGAFAILGITCAALTSLGRERVSAALTASAAVLVAIGCSVMVPRASFGAPQLVASSIATAAALGVCAVTGAAILRKVAGAFVHPLTLARCVGAAAVAIGIGRLLPYRGKLFVLVEAGGVAVAYVLALVATRELGRKDLELVQRIASRKRA